MRFKIFRPRIKETSYYHDLGNNCSCAGGIRIDKKDKTISFYSRKTNNDDGYTGSSESKLLIIRLEDMAKEIFPIPAVLVESNDSYDHTASFIDDGISYVKQGFYKYSLNESTINSIESGFEASGRVYTTHASNCISEIIDLLVPKQKFLVETTKQGKGLWLIKRDVKAPKRSREIGIPGFGRIKTVMPYDQSLQHLLTYVELNDEEMKDIERLKDYRGLKNIKVLPEICHCERSLVVCSTRPSSYHTCPECYKSEYYEPDTKKETGICNICAE